jgi:hypothetical protein
MEQTITTETQKDTVKLEKNSKGYNWEIKVFASVDKFSEDDMKRLNALNSQLQAQYGGISNG